MIRPRTLLFCLGVALGASGCKKRPPPPPQASAPPAPSASIVLSSSAAPSASVAEVPDAAPADAATPDVGVEAASTADGVWCPNFALRPLEGNPTLAFAPALAECAKIGKFLCSEAEWQLACAANAELGKTETWTLSAQGDRVVARGGDGTCTARKPVSAGDGAARGALCCDRTVGVKASDKETALKVAANLALWELGLRERKPEDFVTAVNDSLLFAGKELKREELLPAALAQLLPDASDEVTLIDTCALTLGDAGADIAGDLGCKAVRLRGSAPQELKWRLATLGSEYRIRRIDLPELPPAGEQKQRVGNFLPSTP